MQHHSERSALEAFAAAVPVAVCLVEADRASPEQARLRFSNALAQERFGGALDPGLAVDDVFSQDQAAPRASEVCARAARRGHAEHLRIRPPDGPGADTPGEVVVVRRLDPNIVALVCDSDGADWKRAEFHAVVDSALEAILTKSLDGTILSWNAAASQLYGYTEAEAVGMPVTELLPADRKDEVSQIVARLSSGERISEFETSRVRKDGSIVDVSLTITPVRRAGGPVVGAATIARDVTERRLAESRNRLASIVDAAFYPVFSADLGGNILTWNAAAERLFGYSASEMVGAPVRALLGAPEVPSDALLRLAFLPNGAGAEPFEVVSRTKQGDEVVVEVAVSAILDDRGEITASAVVLRDVTHQRRLEERLRQTQKLEAIGSLASGVAHDFNNVLSVIRSATGLLVRELEEVSSRDLVDEIDRAAQHAADLTAQLLAFGRKQLLRPEPTDLNAELEATVGMLRGLVSADVHIELDLADGLPQIEVDRTQLTQVVMNLGANAAEAMPGGGVLTVRTLLAATDAGGAASANSAAVVLKVKDTGKGIEPGMLERIFDPFYTSKSTGTGLGLATVHGIVEQSGGRIDVDSTPGAGTTFDVHFPLAEQDA